MKPEDRIAKLALIGTFLTTILAGGLRWPKEHARFSLVDIGLLGLASHRIGRMIAFERVAIPIRDPFTETVPDETGVSDTVVARGEGLQWTIGELMSCPTCVGTWAALGLYLGLRILPGPTRMLINVFSIAQVAELTFVTVERLEWSARAARVRAG